MVDSFSVRLDRGIVGRVGGEEFALFLTDFTDQKSFNEAERFRKLVQDQLFTVYEDTPIPLTISMGIAHSKKRGITFEELYQHADEALYSSKKAGKNKVTLNVLTET
ncbi:GGDEF domain-containing protein [Paenibacillus psychroresistens]|uniref:GGDEF domain-containing protein n=1 Tax=Paenibacillus psychroresistens TaxID=1778678 RepID=A0A6B8RW46_9BACL|nr:GGDEF domain-containing protein [Paenibacillus psychroresistens]QGQ99633.1 GGDEF domain-containing protein [Paenibacillus psychroresistens]